MPNAGALHLSVTEILAADAFQIKNVELANGAILQEHAILDVTMTRNAPVELA